MALRPVNVELAAGPFGPGSQPQAILLNLALGKCTLLPSPQLTPLGV